jgi:hypothetical protein
LNRCEAVEVLKEILETGQVHCPNLYSLDPIKDSKNYKVSIKAHDNDKLALKKILSCAGLIVNEEKDIIVIS